MVAQLIFPSPSQRRYRLSVAVWWYFLIRLMCIIWPDTSFFWLVWWPWMIYSFYWKTSAWSKGKKNMEAAPHTIAVLFIILRCSGRKSLVWLCEETSNNKHGWTPVKYLNVFHQNRTQKCCNTLWKNIINFLFWVLWTYLATSIKSNNPNLLKLLMFICMKKMSSLPDFFFLWYWKDIGNLLLWVL